MIETGNYEGALNKLENDMLPFIEKRVIDDEVKALLQWYAYYLIYICEQNIG